MNQAIRIATILCAVMLFSGCMTTARLNQFDSLGQTGIALSEAVLVAVTEAEDLTIRADSVVLMTARPSLAAGEPREFQLAANNKAIKDQLTVLEGIRQHTRLLHEYCETIRALASAADAESQLGNSAAELITSMAGLHGSLATVKVGDQTLAEFAQTGTPLLVAELRARALERHLKAAGPGLERELRTTEALAAFLGEKMQADDAVIQGPRELEAVWEPYSADRPLPGDWAARRAAFLRREVSLKSIASLQEAARQFRITFAAAAEGRLSAEQLQSVLADTRAMVEILTQLRKPVVAE